MKDCFYVKKVTHRAIKAIIKLPRRKFIFLLFSLIHCHWLLWHLRFDKKQKKLHQTYSLSNWWWWIYEYCSWMMVNLSVKTLQYLYLIIIWEWHTAWKVFKYGVFSGDSVRIQENTDQKKPSIWTLHAVEWSDCKKAYDLNHNSFHILVDDYPTRFHWPDLFDKLSFFCCHFFLDVHPVVNHVIHLC